MKLYEMDEQLVAIDNLLSESTDAETNEILESAKEQLLVDIDNKLESILHYVSRCNSMAGYYRDEVARLDAKRKTLEKRSEYLKGMVLNHLIGRGVKTAEFGNFNVSVAKKPARVVMTDDWEQWLPDEYCSVSRVPNKTAIKTAMQGEKQLTIDVDGRQIVVAYLDDSGESLRIR